MRGDVTDAGRTNNEHLKIELLSQWKLEAESRNRSAGDMQAHLHRRDSRVEVCQKYRCSKNGDDRGEKPRE